MFSDIHQEGLLSSIINAAFRDLENIFYLPPPLAKATQTAQRISGKTQCAESDGRVHSAGIVQESLSFSSKTCSLFRRKADVSVSERAFL